MAVTPLVIYSAVSSHPNSIFSNYSSFLSLTRGIIILVKKSYQKEVWESYSTTYSQVATKCQKPETSKWWWVSQKCAQVCFYLVFIKTIEIKWFHSKTSHNLGKQRPKLQLITSQSLFILAIKGTTHFTGTIFKWYYNFLQKG